MYSSPSGPIFATLSYLPIAVYILSTAIALTSTFRHMLMSQAWPTNPYPSALRLLCFWASLVAIHLLSTTCCPTRRWRTCCDSADTDSSLEACLCTHPSISTASPSSSTSIGLTRSLVRRWSWSGPSSRWSWCGSSACSSSSPRWTLSSSGRGWSRPSSWWPRSPSCESEAVISLLSHSLDHVTMNLCGSGDCLGLKYNQMQLAI